MSDHLGKKETIHDGEASFFSSFSPRYRIIAFCKYDMMTCRLCFFLGVVLTSLVGNPLPHSKGPSGTVCRCAVRLEQHGGLRKSIIISMCALQGTSGHSSVGDFIGGFGQFQMLCWCVQPVMFRRAKGPRCAGS